VIVLGHQPIVSAKDIVVRSCFSGDFWAIWNKIPITPEYYLFNL
jgi:hypothetical protein